MDSNVLKKLSDGGRPVRKWHELLAEFRPVALREWSEASEKLGQISEISEKTKEFIVCAIDAVEAWPGLKPHLNLTFNQGATIQEMVDVFFGGSGWLKGPHALNYGPLAAA